MSFAAANTPGQLRPTPAATGGLLREEILLLVSCGGELNRLRDITGDVIRRLDHLLRFDLGSRYNLNQWDYRLEIRPATNQPVTSRIAASNK